MIQIYKAATKHQTCVKDFLKILSIAIFKIHKKENMRLFLNIIIAVSLFSCIESKKEKPLDEMINMVHEVNEVNDFKLEIYDFDGIEKFFKTENDKTYVINFWATWCGPCIKELPHFEVLNEEYKSKNVEVILVSLDFPKAYEKKLKPFIIKHKLNSKIIALNDTNSNSWIPKVSEAWSGAIPATLIFNKDKRQFYERTFNYNELINEVEQFLN